MSGSGLRGVDPGRRRCRSCFRQSHERLARGSIAVRFGTTYGGGRGRCPCASRRHRARMLGHRLRVRAREPSMLIDRSALSRGSPRAPQRLAKIFDSEATGVPTPKVTEMLLTPVTVKPLTHRGHGCSPSLFARDRAVRALDDYRSFFARLIGWHAGGHRRGAEPGSSLCHERRPRRRTRRRKRGAHVAETRAPVQGVRSRPSAYAEPGRPARPIVLSAAIGTSPKHS